VLEPAPSAACPVINSNTDCFRNDNMADGRLSVRSFSLWIPILCVLMLCIPSAIYTGSYITMDTPAPKEGVEESPYPDERLAEGILWVVLDGVRRDIMADSEYMPGLVEKSKEGTILEVKTGPLTMTGSCIREMATGVQSRPSEGLNNFHPNHPGTPDGWTLASTYDYDNDSIPDNMVAMLGDYVWRDLYPDRELIPFSQHYFGHADFYRGDEEGYDVLEGWLTDNPPDDGKPNVIVAHLSGPDHVGHRFGTKGIEEYKEKMLWTDSRLNTIYDMVPEDWAIVVTSDHGQTPDGRHGSPDGQLRKVAAVMWGPNISEGVTIPGVKQRDLATLPSALLSLPLPHAVDGRIPLDAFDISQEKKDVIEQWNWNAAIARNEWLKEEGWPYVEGLTEEEIQWDKLPDDELGVRSSDIILAVIAATLITAIFCWRMVRENVAPANIKKYVAGFAAVGASSALIEYNYPIYPMSFNLLIGGLASLFLFGMSWRILGMNHSRKTTWEYDDASAGHWKYLLGSTVPLLCLAAFVLMFPNTRHSLGAYVVWVSCLLLLRNYKENDLSLNLAAISLFVLWIPPLLFSHVRIIGFDLTRGMLVYTQIETLDLAIWCAIGVGFSAGLATLIRIGEFDLKRIGIHAMTFASLPILMVQQSNNVDWIVIGIVLLVLIIGIYQIMTFGKDTERLVITSALAWMTMSWGVWGGSICLIGFASTERLLAGPWSSILEKRSDIRQETARIVMLALLPLTIWYGIWWTLGQVEGLSWDFLYPREIDPGDILLRGGYIGDRWSPSNEWVAFMGAGPVIAVMLVMWRTFHRVGWPLHLLAAALIIRFSFMWLHLSYAADSPRLVFKATWDAFYGIILVLTLTPFVIYQLLRPSSKNSVETVEDE